MKWFWPIRKVPTNEEDDEKSAGSDSDNSTEDDEPLYEV